MKKLWNMKKLRLDALILKRNLIESRSRAQALIMMGMVYVNGQKIDKCGTFVDENAEIHIKEKLKYVSRGGLKLEKARDFFDIDFVDKVVLDIGSSTGGFTDVAIQSGAKRVHAVDVGKNLLHYSLMNNEKIVKHFGINFRYIDYNNINECVDIIVCDVSFISVKKLLGSMLQFCHNGTELVLLVKPQFEAERKDICKNGIVKDIKVHRAVIFDLVVMCSNYGFRFLGLTGSPIKGHKGNQEYLAYFIYNRDVPNNLDQEALENIIKGVVYENSCNNSETSCIEH
jgi:23S rRNA (cytidine1920-2'-O)/16S rRNA (cytidine1409-2'-O)-methyltransferase